MRSRNERIEPKSVHNLRVVFFGFLPHNPLSTFCFNFAELCGAPSAMYALVVEAVQQIARKKAHEYVHEMLLHIWAAEFRALNSRFLHIRCDYVAKYLNMILSKPGE